MKSHFGPRVFACFALCALGCAKPVAPEAPPEETSGGASGSGGGPNTGGEGGGTHEPVVVPGIDEPETSPPSGCFDGFADGVLSLALDAQVASVQIQARDGVVLANGVACKAGDADLMLASVTALRVSGGTEDNGVILELGGGDWSGLLASPEAIQIALAGGANGMLLRGDDAAQSFHHGMRGQDVVIDLIGDGRLSVVAEGLRALGVELGGGDDRLEDITPLAAAAAEAQAEAEAQGADAGAPVEPITELAIPIVASGGDGDDRVMGGSAGDEIDLGAGDDVGSGAGGDDVFIVAGTMDGADTLNGGPGYDQVSYEERDSPLELNLCVAAAVIGCEAGECDCASHSGEAGENDRIVNVEDVTGGTADDVIRGSDAAESLSGGPGNDALFGGNGSDVLYGQVGDDGFEGGPDGDYCDAQIDEEATGCEL